MPDDKTITYYNCIGVGIVLLIVYTTASFLHSLSPTVLEVILACLGLTLASLLIIGRMTKVADSLLYQQWSGRAMVVSGLALAAGTVLQLVLNASNPVAVAGAGGLAKAAPYIGNTPACLESISSGSWVKGKCSTDPVLLKSNKLAYCQTDQWVWDNAACPIAKIPSAKLKSIFKGKKVAFVGDSLIRSSYHQFISLLDNGYQQNRSFALKHSNFDYVSPATNTSISFYWAPFIENVATVYNDFLVDESKKFKYDMIVAGVAYWDALHKRNTESYKAVLDTLADAAAPVAAASANAVNIWLLPTTVVDNLLQAPDKREHMNEENMGRYKKAFLESKAATSLYKTVINPANVSATRESGSVDGVHYTNEVYQVIAHMISNGYALHFPQISAPGKAGGSSKPYVPKKTGSMSSPYHGAFMMVLAVVMLFLMDSFMGIGFFSLVIFGRSLDWEAAYGPLHKKIASALHGGGGGGSSGREKERAEHKTESGDRSAETDSLLLERSSETKNLAV